MNWQTSKIHLAIKDAYLELCPFEVSSFKMELKIVLGNNPLCLKELSTNY